MSAILGPSFWNKLSQISTSVGLKPEDLLTVMYFESAGLDPAANNKNGNASGLIQFMPNTLQAVGYKGTPEEFRQESADRQLDFVARYVSSHAKAAGGSYKSATQYYVANLWPAALHLSGVQDEDANTIILEENPMTAKYPGVSLSQERAAYKSNQVLDANHDGKITYGDLTTILQNVQRSQGFRHALETLSAGGELAVGKKIAPSTPPDKLTQIETMLNNLSHALAHNQLSDRYIKKQAYKELFPNQLLIKIAADDLEIAVEFARILSLALEEELYSNGTIHSNGEQVEVSCTVYGPKLLSTNAALELCNALSEVFEEATLKLGGYKVLTTICPNQKENYQKLDIKIAQSCYNNFHLRF